MKIKELNISVKKAEFLSKAHKENYEKGKEYINSIDTSSIDWKKEAKNQQKNASNT